MVVVGVGSEGTAGGIHVRGNLHGGLHDGLHGCCRGIRHGALGRTRSVVEGRRIGVLGSVRVRFSTRR